MLEQLQQTSEHLPRNQALYDLVRFDPASAEEATDLIQKITKIIWTTKDSFPQRFESDIFAIGEAFRHIVRRHPAWKQHKPFFDVVAKLAQAKQYGSGRGGFVLLLRAGGKRYHPVLIPLLTDDSIAEETISVLRAWGDALAADQVRPYLNHPKAHLRNEAKKYFKKISDQ